MRPDDVMLCKANGQWCLYSLRTIEGPGPLSFNAIHIYRKVSAGELKVILAQKYIHCARAEVLFGKRDRAAYMIECAADLIRRALPQ